MGTLEAFFRCNTALTETIDCTMSGSTCVAVMTFGSKLYISNLGDSRAIIIRKNPHEAFSFEVEQLTQDHKPELPAEQQRVEEMGGRVKPFTDMRGKEYGPHRVWLKEQDLPGLAMSRSFGDQIA
jgi:serine/threonine protein phosphatase PrpC